MSPRVARALEALLWSLALTLAASRYLLGWGVLTAGVATLLALHFAPRLAESRLRSFVFPTGALLAAGAGLLLQNLLTRWPWPSSWLGPAFAYRLAELPIAFLLPFAGLLALKGLVRRHPTWRVLELLLLGSIFAALFAAHRDGSVDRPFFFADPLLSSGRDPLHYLMLLGLGLSLLLAFSLANGRTHPRPGAGLAVLATLLGALFLVLPKGQLKTITELHRVAGKDPGQGPPEQGGNGKGKPERPDRGGDDLLPDSFADQSEGSSDSPVAVVVFREDFNPPLGTFYFRETAFSTYNGIRVVQDAGRRFDRDVFDHFEPGPQTLPSVKSGSSPFRTAFRQLRTTVALMAAHAKPFGLLDPQRVQPTTNPDPRRFFRAYEVLSSTLTLHPGVLLQSVPGGQDWTSAEWDHYTAAPPDPRYAELVARILEGLPPQYRDQPFAKAVAIKLWLDQNGTYTLKGGPGEGEDPVGSFLFGERRGHCVHFAHAACLLYRTAGLPARVAGGYAAPAEFRLGGATLLLRARNAHAWPEVLLRDYGWVPLDISPARNESEPQQPPDQRLQQLYGDLATGEQKPLDPPDLDGEPQSLWARLRPLLRDLLRGLLWLIALLVPTAYLIRLWRSRIPFHCRPSRVPRLAYRAALDALARHGFRRGFGESREAFATRVGLPAFTALTTLHLRHALGAPGQNPEADDAHENLKQLHRELRTTSTPTRKFLARLDPISWIRVR